MLDSTSASGPPRTPRPSAVEWTLLVLGLGLTIHYAWILDDAYIYFRYVDNFVEKGFGWVYNEGEWVEGYTSPLWLLLLTALRELGVDYWLSVRAIGLLSFAGFWWGLVVLTRELSPSPSAGGRPPRIVNAPLIFLALNYATLTYFTSGVEAPFVQLAAVGYALFLVRPERAGASVVVALSPLIRPELTLAFALAIVFAWARRRRFPVLAGGLGCAVGGTWLLFRIHAYADFFPNTFYLKDVALPRQGWLYLQQTLVTYAVYPVAAVGVGLAFALRGRAKLDGAVRLAMLGIAFAIAAYFVRIGGDPRHHRYLAFSFCLAACALAGLPEKALARVAPSLRSGPVVVISLACALLFASLYPPQLSGHPAGSDVKHKRKERINDAHFHRVQPNLAPPAWSFEPLDYRRSPLLLRTRERWGGGYVDTNTAAWCEPNYWRIHHRVVHGAGLTDAVLARTVAPSRKAAHKPALPRLARKIVRLQVMYGAEPGMYRRALEAGDAPGWVERNLESLELIERKIYNRHDFAENLRLALTRVPPIEISPSRE